MDERKLIYTNLLNGVQVSTLSCIFHVTEQDINADFKFISEKIRYYCFKNSMPPVKCDTIEIAKQNRLELLPILDALNLEKKPDLKITTQELTKEFAGSFA